ncbi:interferon lambda receptor 1 [Hippocampus zosterae]|uniref:interferon lambda receptor 1 n=1 Tax=Hippocampus zosterae TaxID=109293 RepID=UPI00223DF450|nr:interferon lambda receptor 1 [Hippocampus zosterae]
MWSVQVLLLLLFYDACLPTGDGNVFFRSKNFYNVLHWHAAKPWPADRKVLYRVQYKRYGSGDPYRMKSACQNITALHCDLTAETPSLPDVSYMARVYADGKLHGSTTSFNPIKNTTLGPVLLSTGATAASLLVRAALPLGPNGVSVADIFRSSKSGPVDTSIQYTFNLTSPEWALQYDRRVSDQFVFNLKSNGSKYCGYVVYRPLFLSGRPESEKAYFCATLSGDAAEILPWPLAATALLAIIVTVSVGATCVYAKGGPGKRPPRSLEIGAANRSTGPVLQQSPERNLLICRATVFTPTQQTFAPEFVPVKPNPKGAYVGPPGSYSPQDVARVEVPDGRASDSRSSVVYSALAAAAPTEWNELPRVLVEDGEKPSPPPQSAACLDVDLCGQLQLHTVRDADGQLKLPSLALQVEKDSERKPLTCDRLQSDPDGWLLARPRRSDRSESSDSGCGDVTPMQTDCNQIPLGIYRPLGRPDPTSGYKQNWMPLDTAPNNDRDYVKRKHPWTSASPPETEGGRCDDDGGFRRVFLEDWVLQIQE